MNEKYAEIINREHFRSPIHIPMSLETRAAQFAPFSALSGYKEAISDTGEEDLTKLLSTGATEY